MIRSVKMKVLQAQAGNHDPRILAGEGVCPPNPARPGDLGSVTWGGGELIFVTEDLAKRYESSGIAERLYEVPEAAALTPPEAAVMPAAKKRVADVPIRDPKSLDAVGVKTDSGVGKATQ